MKTPKKIRNKVISFVLGGLATALLFLQIQCSPVGSTVQIGAILPLTGDASSYGIMAEKGMKLAVEDWNAHEKPEIHLTIEDNRSSAEAAVNAMNKLIDIDGVPVVIGGLASSIALAEAPIANNAKTVLMCAFASSPRITYAGRYIFRIMPSDAFQGVLLAKWLKDLGYLRVAIIYVRNDWGQALKDVFDSSFTKLGGKVKLIESCEEGQTDLRSVIAKVKAIDNQIDAVFVPTYAKEGGAFLRQAKEARLTKPIFGGDPWANAELVKIAGKAANGARFIAPLQYEGPEYMALASEFHKVYGQMPDLTASAGYDATNIVLSVIKQIVADGDKVNGENIRIYLHKVSGYRGATGVTTFDEHGDVISKEFAKRVIIDGRVEKVQDGQGR